MVKETERQRSRLSCLSGLGEEQQQKTTVTKTSEMSEENGPNDARPKGLTFTFSS